MSSASPTSPSKSSRPTPSGPAANAPALMLPLAFVATGLSALLIGVALIIIRPDILATYHYNQYVIATTHLFVLGWITTVVMGAMYQLVPVALETRLHSERMALWQFFIHVICFSGMVWMFWKWDMKQVGHFGTGLAVGVALFVYNLVRTLMRLPRWSTVATAVLSALIWLSLTVTAGLVIAAGKCTYESASTLAPTSAMGALVHTLRSVGTIPGKFDQIAAMHAHAHLGALGVFVMVIVGVSYKLMPMFTLSEVQSRRRAGASILLLNVGLAGSFFAILLRSPWKPAFACLVVAGLVLYALEMRAILLARKRRNLDWGLKSFLIGIGMLLPLSVLGLVLSWPDLPLTPLTGQLENLYGYLGIVGVVSLAIIGMLHKIVPFLVWYAAYSKQIGLKKVPALGELYSERLQVVALIAYLGALAVNAVGIVFSEAFLVRIGSGLLGLSLIMLVVNMGLILRHLIGPLRPKTHPIPPESKAVPAGVARQSAFQDPAPAR